MADIRLIPLNHVTYAENPIKIEQTDPEISSHFSDAENIKIQRKLNAIIGSI